jgi:hypothetical protein
MASLVPADDNGNPAPWKFERAKSSRSKCKVCGLNITQDDMRLGHIGHHVRGFDFYVWFHVGCCDVGYASRLCYDCEGDCEFCLRRVGHGEKEPLLRAETLFSTKMIAVVHLKCLSNQKIEGMNDPGVFSDFHTLKDEDQSKAKLWFADFAAGTSDSDDAGVCEVVGESAGAVAVAGSSFLGYDLQQAAGDFEAAQRGGNIISISSDSENDESPASTSDTIQKQQTESVNPEPSKKSVSLKKRRIIVDEDDDDDDSDEDEEISGSVMFVGSTFTGNAEVALRNETSSSHTCVLQSNDSRGFRVGAKGGLSSKRKRTPTKRRAKRKKRRKTIKRSTQTKSPVKLRQLKTTRVKKYVNRRAGK